MSQNLQVLVGDASGADKSVQTYLARKEYEKVIVFCMAGHCRKNVGNWKTREVNSAPTERHGFAYYEKKDRAMGQEADYGLMIWDGKSRGTLSNVADLVAQGKPVVVYVGPQRSFVTLRDTEQFASLVARISPSLLRQTLPVRDSRRLHHPREAPLF
jgi:hypothetical protein